MQGYNVLKIIYEYLESHFHYEDINNEMELFSIGMDSVEFMMFVVYLEETFDIKVDDSVLTNNVIVTVQDAIEYIERKVVDDNVSNTKLD